MRVLVTGAAGYLGTDLVDRLASHPAVTDIVAYDNLSRGNYAFFLAPGRSSEKVRFVQGELLDTRTLAHNLEGVEVVFHLAARVTTPFADRDAHLFEQVNHWGTAELTYAVEQSNSVRRLVYLSSAAVYGTSDEAVGVGSATHPVTVYGVSKLRGEGHVRRLSPSVAAYVIRCGNVYGYSRSLRFDSVLNRFMFDARYQHRITIHGTGEQKRPFVHVRDVSQVLVRLLNTDLEPGDFDLVTRTMSVNEAADAVAYLYPKVERLYVNQDLRLRELNVAADDRLTSLIEEPRSLETELGEFRTAFTY